MAKTTMKQPVEKGCARVPVVMQQEALECGAASLTMILAYYGKWIPLEQARTDCGVSRDGATAKQILLAAENHGLKVTAYRYEPEALRRQGKFPCVIHWNFNHFAVLCGFRGDKAVLNDPAKGNITLSMEQFDEGFTGVCLQFEPTENFVPSGKPRSVTRYAIRRLRGAGAALTFVVLTTVIVSLIGIITPGFSRFFIDRLLQGENGEWLVPFLCALAGLTAIQLAVEWIRAIYSRRMDAKLSAIGSATFMWHVLRMPMDFFSQRFAGDIQGRMQSNATIANQLVNTFAPLLLNTVMMVFYLAVMLRYSVMLSLVGIVSILVNVCLSQLISKKRVNITRVQKRDAGKLASTTVSGIEMIESIKASGAENGFFERWSGFQASVNAQSMKYAQLQNLLGVAPQLVSSLCNAVVLILGVFLVMNGRFTEGMLMNFQAILSSFAAPTQMLIGAGQTLQELRTDMERIEDVMNYPSAVPEEQPAREDVSYRKLSGRVELKNVTFGYSKLRAPLIENFSLSLQPGSRVALVGASGCGKSTLARLISGLYQPWSGEILFDGKPISEIDRSVFTGSLAVVDQDVTLFEDSVANNIKMFDRSIEDFEMIVAARDARIHEDIMRRPEGYRYPVAEGGKDFSGGQRQRMEIARVLAQDPTIVVLDEATSALDAKTEYEVMNSVKKRDVTCVVVAHRLSTIRDCDEIIVLDHGRVVERGPHAELYAQGGLYTRLVTNE